MNLPELLNKDNFSKEEIVFLLSLSRQAEREALFNRADQIRREYCGDEVHLRGIIEFSNHCSENCMYCGLREDNLELERYRMSAEEIIATAKSVYKAGVKTIVLQSGEDDYYDKDLIAYIIYTIKQETDVAITLCLGERSFSEYSTWKIAGADRYLLKHETSNPKHYSIYHTGGRLENRIGHLKYLKKIGYQVGTGNIIGLPMQTAEDIAEDILLCKELNVDMAAFGPFVPSPFTPYQNRGAASVTETLITMAVTRLVLKNVHIPSTTALDSIDTEGREKGLKAGANVVMPNFTPPPYRDNYQIYANKRGIKDDPLVSHSLIRSRIEAIGRNIAITRGDTPKVHH